MDDLEERFLDRDERVYWEEEMEKAQADRAPITSFRGEFSFLSNFHPCRLTYLGHSYPSAEHAFQSAKAWKEDDRKRVAVVRTPGAAKRMGRKVSLRPDWGEVKIRVMAEVLREKFKDKGLRKRLLATGERELVEGNSWRDFFWGVCDGRGENWLGELLMAERERLEDEQ